MFERSNAPLFSLAWIQQIFTALTTVGTPLSLGTLTLKLFTAGPLPITPNSLLSDFTEATFQGYASVPVAGSALPPPVNLPSGLGQGLLARGLFTHNSTPDAPQNVLGYLVTFWPTGGTETLLESETFQSSVVMANYGDFISLDALVPLTFLNQV